MIFQQGKIKMETDIDELASSQKNIMKAIRRNEPVTILEKGKVTAVIMPVEKFSRIDAFTKSIQGMKSRELFSNEKTRQKLRERKTSRKFTLQQNDQTN